MKLRILSESERERIKQAALEEFASDARNDSRYAAETVRFLAESGPQSMEWWVESLSADPDSAIEMLGFNPYELD